MKTVRKLSLVVALATALLLAAMPVSATGLPSGERFVGNAVRGGAAIEPAYDYNTGELTYILTPTGAPFPAKANRNAVAPLYIVATHRATPAGRSAAWASPATAPITTA